MSAPRLHPAETRRHGDVATRGKATGEVFVSPCRRVISSEDSMRVLGIDPGSLITGFGVVEEGAGGLCALAWGAVRTSSSQPLPVRLKHIYDGLSEALHTWQPETVAVERVFFAENPKTALILGQARGVALLAVAN